MNKLSGVFLLAVLIIVTGCAPTPSIKHPDDISTLDINNSIQIIAPQAWNTFKVNEFVSLLILNQSNKTIAFDQDFGKRLFIVADNQLIETEDRTIAVDAHVIDSEGNVITSSNSSIILKSSESTGFTFRVDTSNEKVIVRVYVTGVIEETKEPVTAFADITLSP